MVLGTVARSFSSSSFFSTFCLQSSSAHSNTRLCVEDGGHGVVCQKLKINNNTSRPRRYFNLTHIFVPNKCW